MPVCLSVPLGEVYVATTSLVPRIEEPSPVGSGSGNEPLSCLDVLLCARIREHVMKAERKFSDIVSIGTQSQSHSAREMPAKDGMRFLLIMGVQSRS